MNSEIINTTEAVVGEIAVNTAKNTTCTINLSGVPAAVTVTLSVALICGTVITLAYLNKTNTPEDPRVNN